jgi:hypothetical protein
MVVRVIVMVMVMVVPIPTGWIIHLSTSWLAWVPAASLSQDDPPPKVASQLPHLFPEGHGLVQVGKKIG